MTEQTPPSEQWKRPSLPQWRREEAAGLWEPREGHGLLACLPRAWALPSEDVLLPGAGCGLRGNSGYQDACLQSGPASRPEQEQLVVIMHRSFRGSCWLRIQCWARLHTGCPASGNNGDRNPRRQGKGRRSRMRVKTARERGRELFPPLPRLNGEKPGRTPGSHSQTHNPSLRPSGSSFLTLFSFFKAVPAELPDFKKCAWLTYRIALLSLLNLN